MSVKMFANYSIKLLFIHTKAKLPLTKYESGSLIYKFTSIYRRASIFLAKSAFGATPTFLSTISPFLKKRMVGMFRIPY